jgi:hypothetical protein
MLLTETQATEQLQNLIHPIHPLPVQWLPFSEVESDYDVLEWVRHPDNDWCSGKKEDFKLLVSKPIDYQRGDYARTVLLVLGIRVKQNNRCLCERE